jgi:phosphatidate cytidylyltransferase
MTSIPPKSGRFSDLGIRAASGFGLGLFCLLCATIGGLPAALLAGVLVWLLHWEYLGIVRAPEPVGTAPVPLAVLSVGGLLGVLAVALRQPVPAFAVFLTAVLVAGLVERRHFVWLAGGALYIGIAIGGLLHLRIAEADGLVILLWIVLTVIASDVGAYFTGRAIGGRKLCPSISPGKTRSGAVGGLLWGLALSLVFAGITGWPALALGFAGLAVALASQAGDLLESWIKRRAGVKDSGVLLPGHGGFLDRLDGVLGGAWAYMILDAFGLGGLLH